MLAVITGASRGIGESYARQLAARGYGLHVVARDAGRLAAVAAGLRAAHHVPVEEIVLDLALGQSDAVGVIRYLDVMKFKGSVLLISGRDVSVLAEIEQIGKHRHMRRSLGGDPAIFSEVTPDRVNELGSPPH